MGLWDVRQKVKRHRDSEKQAWNTRPRTLPSKQSAASLFSSHVAPGMLPDGPVTKLIL